MTKINRDFVRHRHHFGTLSQEDERRLLNDLAPIDTDEPCPKCSSCCTTFNLDRRAFCRRCGRPRDRQLVHEITAVDRLNGRE